MVYTGSMRTVSKVYYFFTPYTDGRERAVARFFKGLAERSNKKRTKTRLDGLLQQDIAVINLWTEYRYKGYKYLDKATRKQLYANLRLIEADFDDFYARFRSSAAGPEKPLLIRALMAYFSPARGVYQYRESSSFGRLLRDPSQKKLVGDCNQIVTLYIHLYSRYYDAADLRIRALPNHVALHHDGLDIETTNGTIAQYGKHRLLPVAAIVSINLLDTTDSYLATHEIAPEDFLQASRFAFILSHDRDIATHNLKAAYGKLVNSLMERHDYKQALRFAVQSRDRGLLGVAGHNGAVYEMRRHDYAAARRYAKHAAKQAELTKSSWQAEGAHHYQNHRYHDAIKAFKHLGDQKLIRQCYEALFFAEQAKLGSNLTVNSLMQQAGTVKRMRTYAKKSGNKKLARYADSLSEHLKG